MKKILCKILCCFGISIPLVTSAADWPTRPITIVVGATPGAAADQIARSIQSRLPEKLGVPVVIVYKPGADGKIGTNFVVKGNDDHTILLSIGQVNALTDPIGDHTLDNLKPISIVAVSPTVITTASDSKITDAKQMLLFSDLKSGAAAGTVSEFLLKAINKNWVYAGYKGGVPMFTDLMAKHIDIGANSIMGSYSYINGGKLRPLIIFSKTRMTQFPEVPTSYELGIPLGGEVWWGFLGTRAMPDTAINKLSAAINSIVKESEFYDKLTKQGAVVLGLNPSASSDYIKQDLENLNKVFKEINK